jgi:gentisate 1,2-dioxygenase
MFTSVIRLPMDTLSVPPQSPTHVAAAVSVGWVHDQPLLTFLGVRADTPRFKPTIYEHEDEERELKKVQADPKARDRSRVSMLLANKNFPRTETITHVLWAMFGVLPAGAVQLPHRHQSVALDLIIDCKPGCYSLLGERLDRPGTSSIRLVPTGTPLRHS